MYKDVLRSIEGIWVYPSISLILFLLFFLMMIIYLFWRKKEYWDEIAQIPLKSAESGESGENRNCNENREGHENSR